MSYLHRGLLCLVLLLESHFSPSLYLASTFVYIYIYLPVVTAMPIFEGGHAMQCMWRTVPGSDVFFLFPWIAQIRHASLSQQRTWRTAHATSTTTVLSVLSVVGLQRVAGWPGPYPPAECPEFFCGEAGRP